MYFIWNMFCKIPKIQNNSSSPSLKKPKQLRYNNNKFVVLLQLDERICLFSIQKR